MGLITYEILEKWLVLLTALLVSKKYILKFIVSRRYLLKIMTPPLKPIHALNEVSYLHSECLIVFSVHHVD